MNRGWIGLFLATSIVSVDPAPTAAQNVDSLVLDARTGDWSVGPGQSFVSGHHFFDAGHAVTISIVNGRLLSSYVPHITELSLPVELPAVFGAGELNPLTTGAGAVPSIRAGTDLASLDVGPDSISDILDDLFDLSRPDRLMLDLDRDFHDLVEALRGLARDHSALKRDIDGVRGEGAAACSTEACATIKGISAVLDELRPRVEAAWRKGESDENFDNHAFRALAADVDRAVGRIGLLAAEIDSLALESRYTDLETQTDIYRSKTRDFLDNLTVHTVAAELFETLGLDRDAYSRGAASARQLARLSQELGEVVGPIRLADLISQYDRLLRNVISGAPARARTIRQRVAELRARVDARVSPPPPNPLQYAVENRTALLWAAETQLDGLTTTFRGFALDVRRLNTDLASVYRDMNRIAELPRAEPVRVTLGQWSGNYLIHAALLEHRGFRPYGQDGGGVQEPILQNPNDATEEGQDGAPSRVPASQVVGFRPASSFEVSFEVHRRVRFAAFGGVFLSGLDQTEWTSEVRPVILGSAADTVQGRFLVQSGADPIRLNPVLGAKMYLPHARDLYPGARSKGDFALLLGVAVNDPLDNYYLGVSWEPITGLAFAGGVHVGRDLVPDDTFTEGEPFAILPQEDEDLPDSGADPPQSLARSIMSVEDPRNSGVFLPVREATRGDFFIGLSLNTNIFQSVFGKVTSLGPPSGTN